jgi:hypothetical protein
MGALILLAMVAAWFGFGLLLWRLLAPWRASRRPIAKPWVAAMAVAWLIAPWGDEIWGNWVFKRQCEAMPETTLNIPVAVGAGAFFDEAGHRKLWTADEVRRGLSPFPTNDPKVSYAEHLKFMKAINSEFSRPMASRRIRSFPVPIIEQTTTYVHTATGQTFGETRMLSSPGGWVSRLTGFGSHAPHVCDKPGRDSQWSDWIKF